MNEFFARWETESPLFFKRLGKFGKWLALTGGLVAAVTLAAPSEISEKVIATVRLVSSYMVFGGGIVMAICGLTVDSREEMENKMQKKD
jgi:uncharacterized membrane protein YraQ (UPF0718 family)